MDKIFGHSKSKKSLSSEIVNYEIFIVKNQGFSSSEILNDFRIKCLAYATSLTDDYIWHNEGFNLALSNSSKKFSRLGMNCGILKISMHTIFIRWHPMLRRGN